MNTKKEISTRQLARDLELPVKTAWSVAMRVSKAFKSTEEAELTKGIFEMDETYVKNSKNDRDDDDNDKRGGHSNKKNTQALLHLKKRRRFESICNSRHNRLKKWWNSNLPSLYS
ncbi:MAG: hypothetical protein ACI9CD_000357 [Candidatus Deianiraeaceae bacterium]